MSVAMSDITPKPESTEAILEHFGVKGMRWGVRKQRPVSKLGTLSPSKETPKKAASGDSGAPVRGKDGRIKVVTAKPEAKPAPNNQAHNKPMHSMSDEELRQAIARINMERQFTQLTAKPQKGAAAKAFVGEVLRDVGKQQAKVILGAVATQGTAALLKSANIPVPAGKKKK